MLIFFLSSYSFYIYYPLLLTSLEYLFFLFLLLFHETLLTIVFPIIGSVLCLQRFFFNIGGSGVGGLEIWRL